jgi:hypothetical protein
LKIRFTITDSDAYRALFASPADFRGQHYHTRLNRNYYPEARDPPFDAYDTRTGVFTVKLVTIVSFQGSLD